MAYIGNTPEVNTFAAGSDNFNGDAATTTFTLSRNVTGVNDVIAVIENVVQDPFTAYTIAANNTSGTADITFTSAPPSGTGNIQVRYNYAQIVTYDIINGNNIIGGTVSGPKIADATITGAKIANSTISNDKLTEPFTTGKAIAMSIVFGG